MTERVDKDSLPLDKPRRTPGHPTKSHIVKTRVDGKERIIRFGEQGASTAGKPKAGESDRMKQKRASFKARHAKNIAKGKSSPAYWADKVKWATGGPVELREMHAKYAEGGDVKSGDNIRGLVNSMRKMFSLDAPKDMTTGETVADIAAGFVPGLGTAQAARDFERARREGDKLGMGLAGVGMVPVVGGMVKPLKAAAKSAGKAPDVKEQKMLMGVYRGYAGEAPGETVYHAGAEFVKPNPGLFTSPEREAVQQFQRFTGAPRMYTFEAKPRRTGGDEDVYAMARRLGIYEPGIPAGQYLEQGENAIFPQSRQMVEELHNMGIDSLRLKDGMGKQPSLVALDPEVLRPAQEIFATPQKRVADYYAQKRAAQTGQAPHVEMVLVDPFAGRQYGHSTMGTGKQEPMITKARKLKAEDVKSRTQLYAEGGYVEYDPAAVDDIVNQIREGIYG